MCTLPAVELLSPLQRLSSPVLVSVAHDVDSPANTHTHTPSNIDTPHVSISSLEHKLAVGGARIYRRGN